MFCLAIFPLREFYQWVGIYKLLALSIIDYIYLSKIFKNSSNNPQYVTPPKYLSYGGVLILENGV
jgi:hypothetical protein